MSYKAQITRRNPAEAIGSTVEQLIASIPQSGFEPQGQTNILFQLEFMPVNCEAGDEIIVITDGIEASPDGGDPNALLERGEGLPTPKTPYLEGCAVIFLGVGLNDQGSWPRETVHNLVSAWRSYFKSAGADFRPIVLVH